MEAGRRDAIVEREASTRWEEKNEAKFDFVKSQLSEIKETMADLKDRSNIDPISAPTERRPPPEKYDTNVEIRISGLDEYKSKPNEKTSSAIINFETQQVEEIFDFLGEEKPDIKNIRRLGKRNTETDRPRTMILTLSNPWTVRKILSKAPMLKNFKHQNANKVYMSKSLTKSEQLKQKACLQKRWKLITEDGINRKDISVRNFEVYVNGKRVENLLQNITKEFYILCFNIRSLYKVNRRQTFSNYLLKKNYDIICIAETWLTEEIAENELFLPQYQCFVSNRKSTPKTTSHGGTMICIKRTINSEQLYFDYEVNGSVIACNATLGKKNTLILCCYFPPENSKYAYNEDHLQSFFRNIGILQKKFNEVMIYGDFNFPTINWKSLSSSIHLENKFLEHLESHALQQKVNFHTASSGILDLFLVSDNVQVVNVVSIEYSNISKLSNHYPFEVQFSVKISDLLLRSCVTQQIYSFCSGNYGELSK